MKEQKQESKSSGFAFYMLVSLMGISLLLIVGYLIYSMM
jgi:hypothetical protein